MYAFRKPTLDIRIKLYTAYKRKLSNVVPYDVPLKYYSDCNRQGDLNYKSNVCMFYAERKETLNEKCEKTSCIGNK